MAAKIDILRNTFENEFDMERFVRFIKEFFNKIEVIRPDKKNQNFLSEFRFYIRAYTHVANYTDNERNKIAIFAVEIEKGRSIERARSMQRNYISKLLTDNNLDAAIVAFYIEGEQRWRLSLVRLDLEFTKGKVKVSLTPAKRYSYLVGKGEPCHTAMEQLYPIFMSEEYNPTLDRIEEAFSVETVTKEFFDKYREKYLQLKEELERNESFREEAETHKFTSEQFAKKLMGQIVFLYFLQKKGWLGVKVVPGWISDKEYKNAYFAPNKAARQIIPRMYTKIGTDEYKLRSSLLKDLSDDDADVLAGSFKSEPWGSGTKTFIRDLFDNCINYPDRNYFEDYLEPLFYEALNRKRGEHNYYKRFNCKIPFLNGGLFEPINEYDWSYNKFSIPNKLFSNKCIKGERDADGILDIFDRYNFTMNEDEPLEREVAVDPEMLGKIFENLLDVKDRKSKGAFYTPREIVHYMCQESLINHLSNETGIAYEDIKEFIIYGELMKDEDCSRDVKSGQKEMRIPQSIYENLKKIDDTLANVRVADPAVGSGAFPLGMLSEIVRARNNITYYYAQMESDKFNKKVLFEVTRSPYKIKWDAIKNSIFAVDIEASAVDIAKLRLWLSLVVDQEVSADNDDLFFRNDNKDPKPLPNLDCNIMCGNSLIDEFEGIKLIDESLFESESDSKGNGQVAWQISMFQDQINTMTEELFKEQDRLFDEEDNDKKIQIKKHIDDIIDSLIKAKLSKDNNQRGMEKYKESLQQKTKPYFLWKLEFAKIFKEKGGFDIVIGNPPYIGQKGNAKLFEVFRKSPKWMDFYERKQDLYYYFIAQGIMSTNSMGQVSYIIPPYFLTASGAKKLRNYIVKHSRINKIVNFSGNTRVFESASINSIILLLDKLNTNERIKIVEPKEQSNIKKFARDFIEYDSIYETNNLDSSEWYIYKADNNVSIKLSNTVPLGLIATISPGIQTGCDRLSNSHVEKYNLPSRTYKKDEGIFVLTGEEIEIFNNDELRYIKPMYKNSDIKKWSTNSLNRRWILITNEIDNIDNYKNIKQHLLKYKVVLDGRFRNFALKNADREGKWWFLYGYRPNTNFDGEKIVNANRSNSNIFSYSNTPFYATMDVFFTVINNMNYSTKYVTAIMNSKLMKYWLMKNCKQKGSMFELIAEPLSKMPIKSISKNRQDDFERLVDNIILLKKENMDSSIKNIERQIDKMVYKIYDLTEDEIRIIEEA